MKAGITSGGAAVRCIGRSTSARWLGQPQEGRSSCPHLGGHGLKGRRRCRVVVRFAGEEEEEEGGGASSGK
jgi:hypothetical protein